MVGSNINAGGALDTEFDNQFFTKGRTLNNDNNHFYSAASFLSEMNAWVNTFSKRIKQPVLKNYVFCAADYFLEYMWKTK